MNRIAIRTALFGLFAVLLVTGSPANASFPGDNGVIAFSRSTHGQNDIWVVQPDSTGTQRITHTAHRNEAFPDWNATGARLSHCCWSKAFAALWASRIEPTSLCGQTLVGSFQNIEVSPSRISGGAPTPKEHSTFRMCSGETSAAR